MLQLETPVKSSIWLLFKTLKRLNVCKSELGLFGVKVVVVFFKVKGLADSLAATK